MRLLLDENLSPRLATRLSNVFPEVIHVSSVGLDRALDEAIWNYARIAGYVIVTRDSDFSDLVVVRGFPPKVVWLRLENPTTLEIEQLLRNHAKDIEAFATDPDLGILTLF